MRSTRSHRLARLAGAALTATLLATSLAACGDAGGNQDEGAASSGPWEFTDDRGKTIKLPKRPKRIVAQVHSAAALWDFGVKPVGVFGPQKTPDGKPDPQVGNVDLNKVGSVGSEFGEFDLEKFAKLDPDLVVTIMYGPALWYIPEESLAKIEKKAPVVGIRLDNKSADEAIAQFEKLAASLGADLNSDAIKQAKAGFEQASKDLAAAAKAKKGLSVEVAIGQEEGYWVADPKWHGDAKYLSKLGLDIVAPKKPDPAFGFEQLSWEQAGKYKSDLILEDARTLGMTPDQLTKKYPTWNQLPAVKAKQVGPWHAETPSSYTLYTKMLTELTEVIKKARTDIV